jgi:hypothetical protein
MRVSKFLSTIALTGALTFGTTAAFAQQASAPLAVSGALSARDAHDSDGHFFRTRTVNLTAGDTVEIRASSSEFDTVLRVSGPAGLHETNDDAPGDGTNSRLAFRVPATGAYQVTVTSYNANETGSYQLSLEHGASLDDANNAASSDDDSNTGSDNVQPIDDNDGSSASNDGAIPPQPQAWAWDDNQHMFVPVGAYAGQNVPSANNGVATTDVGTDPNPFVPDANAGTGTVYGIFVGVSDYGGSSNLDYTANDARQLARAFEQRGLIRHGNAIVLTDGAANEAQVRQAFQTLAPRVTSRDTFVFFFDGHGDHHEVELQSGSLQEGTISQLLDTVRGQQLVVLDSCYSGSLAPIVRGHSNRIALFSSRANETSYVASEVQAGGWLAYFMIQAIRHGVSGSDGALHVADLVNYVQGGYSQRVGDQQHLVVTSGAPRTATLWRTTRAASSSVAMAQYRIRGRRRARGPGVASRGPGVSSLSRPAIRNASRDVGRGARQADSVAAPAGGT